MSATSASTLAANDGATAGRPTPAELHTDKDFIDRHEDLVRALRVKAICNIFHATAMCVGSPDKVHPEWLTAEMMLYAERKREVVALVDAIQGDVPHGYAMEHVIAFCLDANEIAEAKRLFAKVRSEAIQGRITAQHPAIGWGREPTRPPDERAAR